MATKVQALFSAAITVGVLAFTLFEMAAPANAKPPVFMAGIANGGVCNCPVMYGNCGCLIRL